MQTAMAKLFLMQDEIMWKTRYCFPFFLYVWSFLTMYLKILGRELSWKCFILRVKDFLSILELQNKIVFCNGIILSRLQHAGFFLAFFHHFFFSPSNCQFVSCKTKLDHKLFNNLVWLLDSKPLIHNQKFGMAVITSLNRRWHFF